jgi:hypothetical protein
MGVPIREAVSSAVLRESADRSSLMSQRDHWINKHLWRLHFGQFLQRAIEWIAVYLLILGVSIFLVRRMAPSLWPHVLWLAVGVIPVTALAWWMSRSGRFTRRESVALLDESLRAGGLLMTLTEVPDAEWEARLPQVEQLWRRSMPRFRAERFANFVLPPLVFAIAVCFVPLRETEAARVVQNTAAQQATQELESLLTALDETDVLEEEEKQTLKEEIAKLQEETETSPLTHEKWETVDALQQRMRLRLEEASMDASTAAQAAAMLASAASGDGEQISAERLAELESEVLETLQKMSKNGALQSASPALQDQLQRLIKSGQLKMPEDLQSRQQTLDDLSEFLDQEAGKLSELRKQCQGGKCSKCGGECDSEGNCKDGECNGGECSSCGKACSGGVCSSCQGSRPGRGGISRGRADAELTWGDESDAAGTKFKETVLPPGMQDQPKEDVLGITKSAPQVEPATSQPRSAARDSDPTAGRETWDRTLRPRHRGVVRKFFDNQ